MFVWSFTAIGTDWTILIDGQDLQESVQQEINAEVKRFDQTYSRFISDSLVCQIASSPLSRFTLTPEFRTLLSFGISLEELTHGHFNLNTSPLQEAYGYDANYTFHNTSAERVTAPAGEFELIDQDLVKSGVVKLDFGAYGKGYLIDLIADLLRKHKYPHYLVDGGRDFYGTQKATGHPWMIALEHPTQSDEAVGVAPVQNQGLACSNSHHRSIGRFHHLLDAQTGQPVRDNASIYVLAPTACLADGISTALFVSPEERWSDIIKTYPCEFVTVKEDRTFSVSPHFPGEIFQ